MGLIPIRDAILKYINKCLTETGIERPWLVIRWFNSITFNFRLISGLQYGVVTCFQYMHRWQRGQMHGIANPESRGFESLPMFQDLGRKVFMDAHSTVTAEEGDRYPLRPPKF